MYHAQKVHRIICLHLSFGIMTYTSNHKLTASSTSMFPHVTLVMCAMHTELIAVFVYVNHFRHIYLMTFVTFILLHNIYTKCNTSSSLHSHIYTTSQHLHKAQHIIFVALTLEHVPRQYALKINDFTWPNIPHVP